jgi:hypothetical protein
MAEATTFTSLKEDVRRYLERGNPEDTEVFEQIPRLITLAEKSIARKIKVQGFLSPLLTAMAAGVSVYAKPARWRETVSMNIGTGASGNSRHFLLPRAYEYCRTFWPNSDERDLPQFYADYNFDHWLIVPTPVASYNWEVMIYQLPPLLGVDRETNWLTDYAPNALLYRTLIEAEPFLKKDQRIATWKTLYEEEISNLDTEDLQNIANRASVRTED